MPQESVTSRIHPWNITALQKKYANRILIILLEHSTSKIFQVGLTAHFVHTFLRGLLDVWE